MYFELKPAGYIIRIRVTPNASKTTAGGIFIDTNNIEYLKISLTAVPEKGKANQELIKFLSHQLNISKTSFEILSGQTGHYKKVALLTTHSKEIEDKLISMEQTL